MRQLLAALTVLVIARVASGQAKATCAAGKTGNATAITAQTGK